MKTFFEMIIVFALALITMLIGMVILGFFDIKISGANFFVVWISCIVYHFSVTIFDNWNKENKK